jgi:hypothetical protein
VSAYCLPTTIPNIRGPRCKLHHFYRVQNGVHLKDFQPRRRKWVNHMCMTSVAWVAHYLHTIFMRGGMYCRSHFRVPHGMSQYTSIHIVYHNL